MKTPESQLKEQVKKYLLNTPRLWFWMPVPNGFGIAGIPDFVGCWEGKFFAIETKAPKGKETSWQRLIREKIIAAGGLAVVAYKMEDLYAIFTDPQLLCLRDPNTGADNSGR